MSTPPPAAALHRYLAQLHEAFLGLRDGAVADYIPELARVDADRFGIAVATVDGHVYGVGDLDEPFTIQSVSKPFVYGLALQTHGVAGVLARVGVEPSGEAFNSISLEPDSGRPLNPMINAGAIAATSLVGGADAAARERAVLDLLGRFAGRALAVDDAVYASEARTGHRNRALAHLMRGFGIIGDDPEPHLDLYFRQCAVRVTCRDLAIMAAGLANHGVNPVTGERALARSEVARVLAVMASCGMYDFSGGWLYRVGMPAKSGVGGGLIAVLPGQLGIAVFSPRLDARGNSARGIAVCERFSQDFDLHLFQAPRAGAASVLRARSDLDPGGDGARVPLYELQGEPGLCATDALVDTVLGDPGADGPVILDLRRVVDLEQAASRMLAELARDLRARGGVLLLIGGDGLPRPGADPADGPGEALRFADLDGAMAWVAGQRDGTG